MNWYLVFGGRKWKSVMGEKGITWEIIGIFNADDGDKACLAAMKKSGMATVFAIDGYAFGVDTLDLADTPELGVEADPMTRLERMGRRLEEGLVNMGQTLARGSAPSELPPGKDHDG